MSAPAPRRTFAIISHPDAGKTTLTEKLLLFGGAIHMAGEVRARGQNRRARSDWMKIEQARGISVTSSVMTFERGGTVFNLLDTPGHEDFSEDTYRTLTAVDSAVMVIDAARGIEAQTRKLFEVCRLRDVPILTFINKVDREGRDPFELLDEVADMLALDVAPLNWPAGMGGEFKGLYDLRSGKFQAPDDTGTRTAGAITQMTGLDDPRLDELCGPIATRLRDQAELALGGYATLDPELYRKGALTPVLFGSALKDFGVEELIDALAEFAPSPRPQPALPEPVKPTDPQVSGFVFKVQANMNPQHRDRIAFLRIASGRFRRGMKLRQVATGKAIAINSPIFFFAQDREIADEAFPGDIIGIPNHGVLRVGDSLVEKDDVTFTGIPNFAPEILRRVKLGDPTKSKQLRTALTDMAEEGVTQLFKPMIGSQWIVGVVGQLQLEVLISRLEAEYRVAASFEPSPYETARWISGDPAEMKRFMEDNRPAMAEDRDGGPVFMARDAWELNYTIQREAKIRFSAVRERA
ncbi:peptide chain release factor 3 [Polymorphobacter glacialis]|uniref:Peptide chain release factor 3 n=1 Tax=Sandarakinorhabdus glacialis TaxID=1614636 RepID=A0A917E857_9SPHN|nr:peptide chain release factor 3 [Polymorphobacter glacialis]GGE10140.1 peptide chain release factor 3 [Polymorphobacter glacialis]